MFSTEVVSCAASCTIDAEVDEQVAGGEIFTGQTDVEVITFDVSHHHVVGTVTAHHTRHCIAGRVEGVSTVPICIRTVNVHDFWLEACRHVGSTGTVS